MKHNRELNNKYRNYLVPKIEAYLATVPQKHDELCKMIEHFTEHYKQEENISKDELYKLLDRTLIYKFEIETWTRDLIYYIEMRIVPFEPPSQNAFILNGYVKILNELLSGMNAYNIDGIIDGELEHYGAINETLQKNNDILLKSVDPEADLQELHQRKVYYNKKQIIKNLIDLLAKLKYQLFYNNRVIFFIKNIPEEYENSTMTQENCHNMYM